MKYVVLEQIFFKPDNEERGYFVYRPIKRFAKKKEALSYCMVQNVNYASRHYLCIVAKELNKYAPGLI